MGVLSARCRLTLCDPVDCSLPDCSVHGVFQARIPEWVHFLLSRQEAQQNRQNPCPQRSYVLITNSSLGYSCAPFMDDLNYEWDLACVMFSTLCLEAVIRALLFLTRKKEEEVFYDWTKTGI